jgi:GTP pyrophosphokinase
MRRKGKDFAQISDVRAVRVLVDNVRDCYAALGVVHSRWQYIPGEFDDYIATPKENNYRSIHTAVVGPEGKIVEVQIRTHEMHRQSEFGIAAHWRYKEDARADGSFDKKIAWLRSLLEWKDEVAEATEFVDQFKSEVFSERIYVFTPKGKIVDLPAGATPLDFAYQVHTDIGHRCRRAIGSIRTSVICTRRVHAQRCSIGSACKTTTSAWSTGARCWNGISSASVFR